MIDKIVQLLMLLALLVIACLIVNAVMLMIEEGIEKYLLTIALIIGTFITIVVAFILALKGS